MFKFTTVHVIDNPSGHAPGYNFSLVGLVPSALMDRVRATSADVMAGRAIDGHVYKSRKWEAVSDIVTAARAAGIDMCSIPTCACRKLF